MESTRELLIAKYSELRGYEHFEEEWEPRIKNMLAIVCQGKFQREDILFLKDTSITSNGGSGIVFTSNAICVKDLANSTSRFIAYYRDIEYCWMEEYNFLGQDVSRLELHMRSKAVYRLSICLHGLDLEKMHDLIEYATVICEEDPSEETEYADATNSETGKNHDDEEVNPDFEALQELVTKGIHGLFEAIRMAINK